MLKLLRNNTKTIIWIVVIGFALWGAGTIALERQQSYHQAGKLFGKQISQSDFHFAQQALQLLTSLKDQPDISRERLDEETWNHLALVYEARQRGIAVTDEEVTGQIRQLFGGTQFNSDVYMNWVRSTFGNQPRKFEEQIRNLLLTQKLLDTLRPQIEPTDEEVWSWYTGFFSLPKTETDNPEETDKVKEAEAQRKNNFDENIEQWRKTYIASKQAEAMGAIIEDLRLRAGVADNLKSANGNSGSMNLPQPTVETEETDATTIVVDEATELESSSNETDITT